MTIPDSMMNAPPAALKRTPLFAEHQVLGARLVEFGGWEMPVQYSSILEEHRAVRTAAGLFDVSHMGEFDVSGPGALDFLEGLVPNNVGKLIVGQALYSQICNEQGGTIDDLLIYRRGLEHYLVVVNAGRLDEDWAWFSTQASQHIGVTLINQSDATALIALQGPQALAMLQPLTSVDLASIGYYHFAEGEVAGISCIISRTGYTGEDGFELYHASVDAPTLWRALLTAGTPHGLLPAGLGARDTLRLEAGYCLYGHELNESLSPLEADLGWSVRMKKSHDFIGRAALSAQKDAGLQRQRVGIVLLDRGVARADCVVLHDGAAVGILTSGTMSPTLGKPIALGYVPPTLAQPGTLLEIDIRGKHIPAVVVALPFYTREKK